MGGCKMKIYLCDNIKIPLDLSQQQQFSTALQQKDYFCVTNMYKTFDNVQLNQLESSYFVVATPFETLIDAGVNYMAIEYPNGKMTYCFITRITPEPNPSHATIYYVKDVWQTRMFDWTFKPSQIEKQHMGTKTYSDCEQDVGVNNYRTFKKEEFSGLYKIVDKDNDRWFLVIIACNIATSGGDEENPSIEVSPGGWVDGAFQSCDFLCFPQSSKEWNGKSMMGIADFMAYLTVQPWIAAQIQKVILIPYSFVENYSGYGFLTFHGDSILRLNSINKNTGYSIRITETVHLPKFYANQTPYSNISKLNQMFRAPYSILTINCVNGSSVALDPAYFTGFPTVTTAEISMQTVITQNPRMVIAPVNYKGEQFNLDYSMTFDDFPELTVVYDTGRLTLAQTSASYQAQLNSIYASQSYVGQSAALNASLLSSQKNLADYQRRTSVIGSAAGAVGSLLNLNIGGAVSNAYNAITTAGQASYQQAIYQNQLAKNDLSAAMQNQNYANQAAVLNASRKDAELQGMSSVGLAGGSQLSFCQLYENFPLIWATIKCPPVDEFMSIANNFKMFGFNYPNYEAPNTLSNPMCSNVYNFIKLVQANIEGKLTTEEAGEIKMILQNGVGLYHYPTEIGDTILISG